MSDEELVKQIMEELDGEVDAEDLEELKSYVEGEVKQAAAE